MPIRWGGWKFVSSARSSGSSFAAPALAMPTLIWHISSSANPAGQGIDGHHFMIPLPDPGAGNCIVLAVSFLVGNTPTITDNNGHTWPAASVSAVALDTKAAVSVL